MTPGTRLKLESLVQEEEGQGPRFGAPDRRGDPHSGERYWDCNKCIDGTATREFRKLQNMYSEEIMFQAKKSGKFEGTTVIV